VVDFSTQYNEPKKEYDIRYAPDYLKLFERIG